MTEKPQKKQRDYFLKGSTETRKVNVGYTDFVRRMRLILPIMAVGVIALLLTWSGDQDNLVIEEPTQEEQKPQYQEYQEVKQNELLNPRFESVDSNNNPYTVTADRALQKPDDENVVMLENPSANLELNDETWVSIQAEKGEYEQEEQNVKLEHNVRIFHSSGHQVLARDFYFEKERNLAWTDKPINGSGPDADIEATGVRIDQNDKKLTFNGPARLVLKNASLLDLEPPSAAPSQSNPNDITEESQR